MPVNSPAVCRIVITVVVIDPEPICHRSFRWTIAPAGRGFLCCQLSHRGSNRKPPRSFPTHQKLPSHSCWSPIHSSKERRPAPRPGDAWPPVPEDPTTVSEARSGCPAYPAPLVTGSYGHSIIRIFRGSTFFMIFCYLLYNCSGTIYHMENVPIQFSSCVLCNTLASYKNKSENIFSWLFQLEADLFLIFFKTSIILKHSMTIIR